MKTNHKRQWVIGMLAAFLFALTGCQDISKPEDSGTSGKAVGKALITIGSGGARTLIPSQTVLDALQYELSLDGPEGASLTETFTPDTQRTLTLAEGAWIITAQAKDGSSVKAEGSWNGTISASASTSVNITLLPTSGSPGTLSYTIDYSQVSSAISDKTLTLYPVSESGTGTPVTPTISGTSGNIPLDPGFYRLQLVLTNDAQKTASRTEAVHIYAGLTTPGTWEFLDADFVEAPAIPVIVSLSPENGKLTVTWWSVSGAAAYEVWYGTASDGTGRQQFGGDVPSTGSSAESETITGLTNGTTYYVWVKAKDSLGTSGFSDSASGVPGNSTGDIIFQTTLDDSSSTGFAGRTGQGTDNQTWTITAVETEKVYFAVKKSAAQTITVGGTGVSQAASGSTVDGSTASDTLDVFTVDANTFSLMFEGGSKTFTLTVSELGKTNKTIAVTLNTTPNKTGVAVYRVNRTADMDIVAYANTDPARAELWAKAGSLERITGIQKIEMLASFPYLQAIAQPGDCLLDALAWVDRNAQPNNEYLIRVEKNETLPKMQLTFVGKVNVTLRLRGLEQERVIKHNGTPIPNGYVNTYWNNVAKPSSPISTNDNTFIRFLSGYQAGTTLSLPPVNGHRLYLEQYITIDGLGANRTTQMFYVMLYIDDNARLVMLDGSKITNFHNSSSSSSTQRAIEFKAGGNQPLLNTNPDLASQFTYATFYWYGGSITNNYNAASITHANIGGQRYLSPVIMGAPNMVGEYRGDRYTKKVFFKYGGSFTGNSGGASPGTVPIHYINFGSNNGSAAARILEIDDGGPYEGLVLF